MYAFMYIFMYVGYCVEYCFDNAHGWLYPQQSLRPTRSRSHDSPLPLKSSSPSLAVTSFGNHSLGWDVPHPLSSLPETWPGVLGDPIYTPCRHAGVLSTVRARLTQRPASSQQLRQGFLTPT